jgi:HEAT repeat protein
MKLGDTLLELGRVGDPSAIPKLSPLLAHTSPEVRALAADAMSRLGEPALCEKLLPGLASTTQGERRLVARSFERWKPEPCYKAMAARLEVEEDIGVRGPLYNAIVSMGGESSLDVLRGYLRTGNQFDQAIVIIAIGQVGSKKGLNMLRALLADDSVPTVVRALQSIGAIGGEGAIETLMTATSDNRAAIASSAREVLTDLGIKKVAPQVASQLVGTVREPVTDLAYRGVIAQWGDALVKLGYIEAIDDLSAAAAVQADRDIKESLTSCVRRLRLLAKNHDDVAAWDGAAGSTFVDARRLAYKRLAEIGSAAAVRALAARLAKTDLPAEERAGVLVAIGDARTEGAAELVERHLSDPSFDSGEFHAARTAAAYAARRLGGDRMAKALRLSAVRRDGRDWATLAYLAVLEKDAALPTLKTLCVRRLRYPESGFGLEEAKIDGIISDLVGGRDIKRFDVTPEVLLEP